MQSAEHNGRKCVVKAQFIIKDKPHHWHKLFKPLQWPRQWRGKADYRITNGHRPACFWTYTQLQCWTRPDHCLSSSLGPLLSSWTYLVLLIIQATLCGPWLNLTIFCTFSCTVQCTFCTSLLNYVYVTNSIYQLLCSCTPFQNLMYIQ